MIGYDGPPSRSSTSSITGIGATSPAPPSTASTALALCGRNGERIRLQSATACAVTCSTVPSRSRSSSPLSFQGAMSETYLLTSATTRIASPTACFCRCRAISPPTVPNPASTVASSAVSSAVSSPASGISPKLFAIMFAVRLTRLPQPATSSSLVRRTNSAQVKSLSWFSGPAAEMK